MTRQAGEDHRSSSFQRTASHAGPSTYCDERLKFLRFNAWSKVPVTDSFAASAISLHLETDHATLGLFDVDLFLDDMVSVSYNFCSELLVNALCFVAFVSWPTRQNLPLANLDKQSYSSINPAAAALSLAFYHEASELWEIEKYADCLLSVSAAQFLCIGCILQGADAVARKYMHESVDMGIRMNLLGVPESTHVLEAFNSFSHKQLRATANTAWGLFNWIRLIAHFKVNCG